jgi:hypothetical protein
MALIDDVKVVLRITSTAFNTEINDLILSAKADLGLSGVLDDTILDSDALIKCAITTYCKANFGWDNPDAEKLQHSYEMLRNHLTLSGDYSFYKISFDVGVRSVITLGDITKDTNASGEVVFYSRAENNVTYTVEAEGYVSQTDEIDISADATITLVMVVV